MGEGVLDRTQQFAHFDLDGKLFFDFAVQAVWQVFAGSAFAAGELPQAAQHPIERSLGDEKVAVAIPDDAGRHVAVGALGAGGADGQLVLDAQLPGLAEIEQRAKQAAGVRDHRR